MEAESHASASAAAAKFAAGNKAGTEVFAVGNKAEEAEDKPAEAAKEKMLVKVANDRIEFLLARPPNLSLSHRLRSFTEDSCPFACPNPELRQAILDKLPRVADLIDKWNDPRIDILRQYHESGVAYDELD